MTGTKKSDMDKILDQIRVLADEADHKVLNRLYSAGKGYSGIDSEYGPHTILKLAYLNYYLGIFARIANAWKNSHHFDKVVFIDAFGGSGLVKVRGSKYTILGSSLIASLNPMIDEIIPIEIDPSKVTLLKERLEVLTPGKACVYPGDVNALIQKVVDEHITERTIVLFFVDPEGMEPSFLQLKYLMDRTRYVDILMNFSWGVYRLNGRIMAYFNESDINRMKSLIPTYIPGKDPSNAVIEMFEGMFGKPYGDEVKIKSSGNKEEYSLILRIRKTQSNTAWIKPMEEFGKIISRADGDLALELLRQIKGNQASLL